MNYVITVQYIAGLFDGEGWILITRTTSNKEMKSPAFYLRVGIEMTNFEVLNNICNKYGGHIYTRPVKRAVNRKITHTWYLDGKKSINFLTDIKEFLIIKKKQAEIAIDYQNHVGCFTKDNHHSGRQLTNEEIIYREKVVQEIRSLNSFNALRK